MACCWQKAKSHIPKSICSQIIATDLFCDHGFTEHSNVIQKSLIVPLKEPVLSWHDFLVSLWNAYPMFWSKYLRKKTIQTLIYELCFCCCCCCSNCFCGGAVSHLIQLQTLQVGNNLKCDKCFYVQSLSKLLFVLWQFIYLVFSAALQLAVLCFCLHFLCSPDMATKQIKQSEVVVAATALQARWQASATVEFVHSLATF